jgi:hypothetical protein
VPAHNLRKSGFITPRTESPQQLTVRSLIVAAGRQCLKIWQDGSDAAGRHEKHRLQVEEAVPYHNMPARSQTAELFN